MITNKDLDKMRKYLSIHFYRIVKKIEFHGILNDYCKKDLPLRTQDDNQQRSK